MLPSTSTIDIDDGIAQYESYQWHQISNKLFLCDVCVRARSAPQNTTYYCVTFICGQSILIDENMNERLWQSMERDDGDMTKRAKKMTDNAMAIII